MAAIIDIPKLREAREAAEAIARLHEVLCIAAEETLSRQSRLRSWAETHPVIC
jgi:hypothetical protein